MALKLMYITNDVEIAKIAQKNHVDRIFIDMEYIGKDDRQKGMDTVKSHHTIEDIVAIRQILNESELLVRINPIHSRNEIYKGSEYEINKVIESGADIVMLPMYKTVDEVKQFCDIVNRRAKTMLLVETLEACEILEEVLELGVIDEFHIGLNDLHLAMKKNFMFELLADGTVDKICDKFKKYNVPFGFGGIARLGYGELPAECIIAEHYRIGSTKAILSRSFCNVEKINNPKEIEKLFNNEIIKIRNYEEKCKSMSQVDFERNRNVVIDKVKEIVKKRKAKDGR